MPASCYTEEISKKICDDLERGYPFSTCCELHGIPARTGYEWLKQGLGRTRAYPEPIEPFATFARNAKAAQRRAECQWIDNVKAVAANEDNPQSWKAAQWLLKKRFGENWEDKVVQMDALTAVQALQDQGALSEDQVERVQEILAETQNGIANVVQNP